MTIVESKIQCYENKWKSLSKVGKVKIPSLPSPWFSEYWDLTVLKEANATILRNELETDILGDPGPRLTVWSPTCQVLFISR